MIIRCPECSTGFNLPDERVTPEGTKLKCSKCKHVFRVRADGGGEAEFFYRPGDNEKDGAGASDSPFAGGDLKPKKSSAFGDLNDDDDQVGAFESAFQSKKDATAELNDVVEESKPQVSGSKSTDSGGFSSPAVSPTPAAAQTHAATPSAAAQPQQASSSGFGGGGDAAFASAAPQAAASNAHAEVGAEQSQPAAAAAPGGVSGPPKNAVGPPPTAQVKATKKKELKASVPSPDQVQDKEKPRLMTGDWDVDDSLAPISTGVGLGTKLAIVGLVLSLGLIVFMWVVAAQNDGFIDFDAFSDMVKVAFSDGEYEPRPEWAVSVPDINVIAPSEPASVEGVHGELVQVGRDDNVFVLQGMVRNNEDSRIHDVELRAMVTTPEGRTMQEVVSPLREGAEIGEFRSLRSLDDLDDLLGSGRVRIDPGGVVPFTLVLDDPPQRVINGERYSFRVEVSDMSGGS